MVNAKNIPGLIQIYFQVVDKLTVWNGKYAAINSFGIGGTNSHVVLRRNEKEKVLDKKINLPRLVAVSGRTEEALQSLLDNVLAYIQFHPHSSVETCRVPNFQ